jgi:elongation factor P
MLYNGNPISLELPSALELEIAECEQAIKGDTVTNVTKTARLATGLEIQVPLFINQGDIVRVDTSEGRYVERVKVGK